MDSINQYRSSDQVLDFTQDATTLRKFFSSVFSYMAAGLGISGVVAYLLGAIYYQSWIPMMVSESGITIFGYVIMFSPLILSLVLGGLMERASVPVLLAAFTCFAVLMGMSLSTIFLIYSINSIFTIFLVTAGTFALFAFLGYTTKADLSKLGTILAIAFGVLILVSLLNLFFFKSDSLSYVMSGIGVLITVGLIAYKIQHLKNIAAGIEYGDTIFTKRALIGAFTLYMSFINLFMFMLRLFGRRGE